MSTELVHPVPITNTAGVDVLAGWMTIDTHRTRHDDTSDGHKHSSMGVRPGMIRVGPDGRLTPETVHYLDLRLQAAHAVRRGPWRRSPVVAMYWVADVTDSVHDWNAYRDAMSLEVDRAEDDPGTGAVAAVSCRHGHAMTPENTYIHSDGAVRCRECVNRQRRERRRSRRAEVRNDSTAEAS